MPAVLCSQVCGLFGAEHMPCALYRHFDKDENLLLSAPLTQLSYPELIPAVTRQTCSNFA